MTFKLNLMFQFVKRKNKIKFLYKKKANNNKKKTLVIQLRT